MKRRTSEQRIADMEQHIKSAPDRNRPGPAPDSELTRRAREVLAGLSEPQRACLVERDDRKPSKIGVRDRPLGHFSRLRVLERAGLVRRDGTEPTGIGWSGTTDQRWCWAFTDLGREVARLLAAEVGR